MKLPSLSTLRNFFNNQQRRKVPLTQNQRLPQEQQERIMLAADQKRERKRQKRLANAK